MTKSQQHNKLPVSIVMQKEMTCRQPLAVERRRASSVVSSNRKNPTSPLKRHQQRKKAQPPSQATSTMMPKPESQRGARMKSLLPAEVEDADGAQMSQPGLQVMVLTPRANRALN